MNHEPPSPQVIKMMKKIGRTISICMGITLSFFLSLTGMLLSGHFTVPGWLVSFVLSTVISLVIGFFVPMKPILDKATKNLHPGAFSTKCLESLISDLIYTPVITLSMVALAHHSIAAHLPPEAPATAVPPFLPMFLHSLAVEMVVGFVLIFIFMPLFMGIVMKKHGMVRPRSVSAHPGDTTAHPEA